MGFLIQKSLFCTLLEDFIKHQPLFSEEWMMMICYLFTSMVLASGWCLKSSETTDLPWNDWGSRMRALRDEIEKCLRVQISGKTFGQSSVTILDQAISQSRKKAPRGVSICFLVFWFILLHWNWWMDMKWQILGYGLSHIF